MNGPLDILSGIRVVDAAVWIAGTGGGALLGSMGAEVIKIEDPVKGDSYRGMARQYGDVMSVKGRHIGFETANLNKKSVTIDLTKPRGREILGGLVAKSDVFHTNFVRSAREKLGLTYKELSKYSPKLVYCVTTGFGSRGPQADRRCYDTLGQAQSGMMWAMGDREYEEPVGLVGAPLDQLAATMMAFGMVCGILARDRHGIGQEVHVSILGGALHIQTLNVNMALLRGRPNGRFQRKRSPNPMSNHYRCADGKWIMLAEPMSDKYWSEFCEALGAPEMKADPRFANATGRSKNAADCIRLVDQRFATRTRDEWLGAFGRSNVNFGYAAVNDVGEAVKDQQAVQNEYVVDLNHGALGPVQMAGFPIWFSKTPARIRSEAPEHGQHTEEVLSDLLGYDWDEIGALKTEGVI